MKPTSLPWIFLFVLACSPFALPQVKAAPAIPYQITGTLLSSANGSPIPHGHLTVTLVPRGSDADRQFPAPVGTFDADDHGRFSIAVPSAGMWRLVASARGYVTQAYDEHESFSSGIVLTAASPAIDGLRFQLSPEATITGNVVDEAGEPIRNARVALMALSAPGPDSIQRPARVHARATTDDRGVYEFDDLLPGDYRVSVQAQVWYAMAAQRGVTTQDQHPLDPSLDVTYPLTWYPGTTNADQAESLSLQSGESRQADFQLLPIPSIHLRILPDSGVTVNGQRMQSYPMIERINPGGGEFVPVSAHIDPQGMIDIGGLAPGRYEIRMQAPGQTIKPALVDVTPGSVRTLDMSAPSAMATISIKFDGIPEAEANSVQVSLIDPTTGMYVGRNGAGTYFLSGALLRQRRASAVTRSIEVPPGRYEVVLNGKVNFYLTGITAQAAEATGRFITVSGGNSTVTLHVADGRATLTGVAMKQGKQSVGAMVLLIPATLGDPAGLTVIRRDQTNTDGSFDLNDVLPGQYILLAIDHGWQVNWRDPSTLRDYMMHGVPVDLTSAARMKETIEAQAP